MTRTAAQIREEFINFFVERHAHTFAPSSPVVPHGDPTLLFTNAGMNQFKDVFLGQGSREYTRAVNSQKCIRAGGKHNDLEDVGRDHYHHTFFEMLGNWSFGDYFKAEAIEWAWTLLTEVWGLDETRLHVTVFGGDENDGLEADLEAETLWARFVPAERISRWDRKDNFWEMGDTGPCGPCSEIHYDFTPDKSGAPLVNAGREEVVEIWNLVFIQFNRGDDGVLSSLPSKHVDTGMGFERITRVLQGKSSNYDTDLWTPIFAAIQASAGVRAYGGSDDDPIDIAYRIIADHVRCLTLAISDGAPPSNEGRGYVLRRILRRAVRHARQTFGVQEPMLCDIVPVVVETLQGAFPSLTKNQTHVADIVREEENSFLRTLDRGIALFEDAADRVADTKRITGDDAFSLHDTFGFPIDLTRVMAEERGLTVDEAGYESAMEEARERSRGGGDGVKRITLPPSALDSLQKLGVARTDDIEKYHGRPTTARIEAIWNGTDFDEHRGAGSDECALIVNRTNFYAEAGGQIADHGEITSDVYDAGSDRGHGARLAREAGGDAVFKVSDVLSAGDHVLHVGRVVAGKLAVGDSIVLSLDRRRRDLVMSHHTTTHLLNHALRAVLGEGVEQRGSLVAPDRLRFDFSHGHPMTEDELAQVEKRVNDAIARRLEVHADVVPLAEAQRVHGVRAVFGERYPDPVRVVSIGVPIADLLAQPERPEWQEVSVEFCGGTHLGTTDAAQRFVIVTEQGLAAGVRRIVAMAGLPAIAATMAAESLGERIGAASVLDDRALVGEFDGLHAEFESLAISVVARAVLGKSIDALRDRVKAARKAAQATARTGVVDQARDLAENASGPIVIESLLEADKETLMSAVDVFKSMCPESAALLFAPDENEGKVAIVAIVPEALIKQGLKAGDWVREAAKACGGGGGGRPDMAQAGGRDPSRVGDAMSICRRYAETTLGVGSDA